MTKLKQVLHLVCLLMCVYILGVITVHVEGWAKIVTKALLHMDEFTNEGKIAMKNLAESSIESKKATKMVTDQLPNLLSQVHGTLTKTNSVLDNIDVAAHSADQTIDAATTLLGTTNDAVKHIDLQTTQALAGLPPLFMAGQNSFTAVTSLVNGPANDLLHTTNNFMIPAQWTMYDLQQQEHKFFNPLPYTGKHPIWHKTKGILWAVPHFTQPTYYGVRLLEER